MPPPPYSFAIQIRALVLAVIVFIVFYTLDNLDGREPFFRNIEDYLQFVTLFYVVTIAFFYQDLRSCLKQLAISLAATILVIYSLKYLINAKRPNGIGGYSFPSGHTSFAFAISAMIHKRYNLYYAIPAYINAILVGYLRVFHNKHYVVDVVCGAIIAIIITWKIVARRN